MPVEDNENVGIAFALVIGAGLSTAVGAAVVFVPSLVRFASRRTLAAGLGLSAGVMTYVSFVEIFAKSTGSFEDAGIDPDKAYVYGTVCFFGGVLFMIALNQIVNLLLGGHHHHHHHDPAGKVSSTRCDSDLPVPDLETQAEAEARCPCDSKDPAADLENLQHMAEEMEAHQEEEREQQEGAKGKDNQDSQHLMQMSINTALAIGIHNFPEGLATFVATLSDPSVGAVLAIAIAIHNVPEGLCVAMPIYYATGNRWKAFGWALLSGVAEPIAALLGWAVLANSFSDTLYAVLFGMVSGMMVIISVRELLPTAHRYDPQDAVVTYSFMTGMGIMAVSLVLFSL